MVFSHNEHTLREWTVLTSFWASTGNTLQTSIHAHTRYLLMSWHRVPCSSCCLTVFHSIHRVRFRVRRFSTVSNAWILYEMLHVAKGEPATRTNHFTKYKTLAFAFLMLTGKNMKFNERNAFSIRSHCIARRGWHTKTGRLDALNR